ncbi:hypothetical protein GCM10010347_63530 [Streptomyces cirratus]|uniref:Uncharacterized protein n=1 Tax=Streptomyces cirratus TaxID=68187 RepID=A0ABQ3F542_9ACTN|nr:hypothetical protein [Streptomyces cirratus]GHB83909.1 hypothetical protein GCM10010347_63530 [Streptomyces cirratus]
MHRRPGRPCLVQVPVDAPAPVVAAEAMSTAPSTCCLPWCPGSAARRMTRSSGRLGIRPLNRGNIAARVVTTRNLPWT